MGFYGFNKMNGEYVFLCVVYLWMLGFISNLNCISTFVSFDMLVLYCCMNLFLLCCI